MSISQLTHQLVNVSYEFTSILPILIQYYLGSFYLSIFATPFPTMRNLTRIILNINLCPGWISPPTHTLRPRTPRGATVTTPGGGPPQPACALTSGTSFRTPLGGSPPWGNCYLPGPLCSSPLFDTCLAQNHLRLLFWMFWEGQEGKRV